MVRVLLEMKSKVSPKDKEGKSASIIYCGKQPGKSFRLLKENKLDLIAFCC
jgi:hypothetical protein